MFPFFRYFFSSFFWRVQFSKTFQDNRLLPGRFWRINAQREKVISNARGEVGREKKEAALYMDGTQEIGKIKNIREIDLRLRVLISSWKTKKITTPFTAFLSLFFKPCYQTLATQDLYGVSFISWELLHINTSPLSNPETYKHRVSGPSNGNWGRGENQNPFFSLDIKSRSSFPTSQNNEKW